MFEPENESLQSGDSKSFESSEEITGSDGWITPDGKFYQCTPDEHDKAAGYLVQSQRTNIDHRLKESRSDKRGNVDSLPPRVVLKAAGYALLSGGLLVEQNLPKETTVEQLELMRRSRVAFAPESGKLDPSVYLEFREKLKDSEEITDLLKDTYRTDAESIIPFINNPSGRCDVYDNYYTAHSLFNIATEDSSAEIVLESRVARNTVTWRLVDLPSGEAFVEFFHHEHAGGSDEYRQPDDDSVALVSKEDIKKFIDKIKSQRYDLRYRLSGDIDVLE